MSIGDCFMQLQAPDEPTYVEIEFLKGDPVGIDGVKMSPATLLTKLNELGGKNGGFILSID